MMTGQSVLTRALLALCLVTTFVSAPADARRGGSFGSRGSRTYSAPPSTRLSPGATPAVSRSMTAPTAAPASRFAPSPASPFNNGNRPRFGFGGGLLAGLVTGGLIGGLLGHGFGGGFGMGGGGGGMLAMLLQLAIIAGIVWLAFRLFRGRRPSAEPQPMFRQDAPMGGDPYAPQPAFGGVAPPSGTEIALTSADQQAFERLLIELQDAFGHEDYARLRAITTPEIMSYLAEELRENATHGRRNEVTGTRLLDGEVSEAWQEGDAEYATIVMRYESADVMRDRTTSAILTGSEGRPTETTELWTFVRPVGAWSAWKVSAIQEA